MNNRHTKCCNWNKEKNLLLKNARDISFEQVVMHTEQGDLVDIIQHPNNEKYSNPSKERINIAEDIMMPELHLG